MNIGCQVSEKKLNRLATARLEREPEVQSEADWLAWATRQFRRAMSFQIPSGYEDEAGFHCGEEPVAQADLHVPERNINLTNVKQF